MAREIKTRFALEGEQKFKSAMKDAANSIKVLNSEQKLAKAQFQQTGDAEKYQAQQAEILKKKIEEQKTAVKAAEEAIKQLSQNGVAENSRQMQQWQVKLNDAQTALVKMETDLQNLSQESQTTTESTEALGDSLESLNTKVSLDQVIGGIGKITGALEAAVGKAKELAGALVSELRDAATWADDLATQALMYGLDVETLQRMRNTADLIDTDVETILKSQQKFMTQVVSSSKETREAFRNLGIYTDKYEYGTFDDQIDLFWRAGEAVMALGDAYKQNEVAQKLFGKSWHELVPLFSAGREEYERTMAEQQVVTEENINKLTELDDSLQNLENRFETLKNTVLAQLAESLTGVSDALSGMIGQLNDWLASEEGKQAMQELSDTITGLFDGIKDIDYTDIIDGVKNAIQRLTDALQWIEDHKDAVVKAIEGIVLAWAGLKVTQGMLTVIQLVNGMNTLIKGDNVKRLTDALKGLGGDGSQPVVPTVPSTSSTPAAPAESAAGGAAGAGMWSRLKDFAGGLLPSLANITAGGAFLAGTYEVAKAVDASYTKHVNEVAAETDQLAESAENATGKVKDLAEQIRILNEIYQEEKGADSFGELDLDALRKVAPGAALFEKMDSYGGLDKYLNSGEAVGAQAFSLAEDLIKRIKEYMDGVGKETVEEGATQLGTEGVDQGVADGINENADVATDAANQMGEDVVQALNDTGAEAFDAGKYIGSQSADGVAAGIDANISVATAAAKRMGVAVADSMRATMRIHSPSKVMEEIGQFVVMGFTEGIDSQLSTVSAAADRMVSATTGSFTGTGVRSGSMVDVTLMLGPEKLSEMLVPLVNDGIGADLALERR